MPCSGFVWSPQVTPGLSMSMRIRPICKSHTHTYILYVLCLHDEPFRETSREVAGVTGTAEPEQQSVFDTCGALSNGAGLLQLAGFVQPRGGPEAIVRYSAHRLGPVCADRGHLGRSAASAARRHIPSEALVVAVFQLCTCTPTRTCRPTSHASFRAQLT
jgi:hypothetical protein